MDNGDIFDDFEETSAPERVVDETSKEIDVEGDDSSQEDKRYESSVPELMARETLSENYLKMADRIVANYKFMPHIDYDKIYQELAELTIKSCPTPTLQMLNTELQKVQAAKDRLAEIFVDVIRAYTFKKRAVDILFDSYIKFSPESSADKRKSEAQFVTGEFHIDFALTDALLKSCGHIIKNLDSLHESLSRRITIIQLQLKLHDLGRGALPDFDFEKAKDPSDAELLSSNDGESFQEGKVIVEEESF
jgi:hypothetical protein